MAMPPCGTFHYVGLIPNTDGAEGSSQWTLKDQSSGATRTRVTAPQFWNAPHRGSTHDHDKALSQLRDNRLVGLEPTLRIYGCQLHLEASHRDWAQVRFASMELDRSLIDSFRSGDVLTLVRTCSANIGVSLLRHDQLIVAAGAVTATALGGAICVGNGPVTVEDGPGGWPRQDTWVDVSVLAETVRLRAGDATAIGNYKVTVVRSFQHGIPGTHESVAISLEESCPHVAAVRSAELLARPNAGLMTTDWS